jgi:hypothetical protein
MALPIAKHEPVKLNIAAKMPATQVAEDTMAMM